MFKTNEKLVANNQATVDTFLSVVNASLNSSERLAALNLNTLRDFAADGAANLAALLTVKSPQELIALQKNLAKPVLEKAVAYSRNAYEILNQSSTGLNSIVQTQAADAKKNFLVAVEQSLKNAPAGSEALVSALKSSIAAADSALENVTNAVKQANAKIEEGVASANQATDKLIAQVA